MKRSRHQARELAITALYQLDLMGMEVSTVIEEIAGRSGEDADSLYPLASEGRAEALAFFEILVRGAWTERERIDDRIRTHLKNWTLERLGRIERALLRLGSYELLFLDDIPKGVTISEMVEFSKCFCDERSKDLINGVLDAVARGAPIITVSPDAS